jgi:hypothetical protein
MLNKLVTKVSSFEPTSKGDRSEITPDDLSRANAAMHSSNEEHPFREEEFSDSTPSSHTMSTILPRS